jgi:plastocyanin
MAKKFLTGLNLVVLDVDPATGSEGELYFNSSASVAKIYQAGSWSVLGAGGGGGSTTVSTTEPESPEIGDSWYKNDTGEFYVYDGTYWVEVNGVVENPGSVPIGGTVGQILAKVDDTDYNTEWIDNAAESTLYLVRNNTGATIPKGTLVAAAGAEPSGRIDVSPYETTGQQDSELRVMGVAIQNIANGVNGTVMSFGTLTGIDTRGTSVSPIAVGDETWAAGDILFAHPTVAGKLTKVRPQHDLAVAFITVRHASTGQIAVRIVPGNNHLEWMHDVLISGSVQNNELLSYDLSNGLWINKTAEEAGLSITSHNHTLDSLSNVDINSLTDGDAIIWNSASSAWVNQVASSGDSYPLQAGNTGKFLQTDGTDVSWQDVSFTGYLTEVSASSTYQPIGSYLTSESDTFETVTDRGASSTNAITISNTTEATNATTGALIVSGGVGVAKDLWIDGNLHVAGTTTTENTKTVATHDNLIYLNAALDSAITNAVFASGSITYTAENLYTAGMDIRITGVSPSAFNISSADLLTVASATPTQFVVIKSDPGASYISGGTAHAKEGANPDLGFAGGYYDAGYAHAGLFRDASDGIFKAFDGYTPEPDEAVNIDTSHVSFSFAPLKVGSLDVVDASTTRTNLGININEIAYSATTRLEVTQASMAYLINNQYTGNNPTIYATAGTTIAFNLDVTGHPFLIKTASGSANYDTGLIHVDIDGTVSTGSAAQGQVSGTLYWQIPSSISGEYAYQCQIHSGMLGAIIIKSPASSDIGVATGTSLNTTGNIISHVDISTPTFTSNAYYLVEADDGKLLMLDNSTTAATLYVGTDATCNFPIGTQITIIQKGAIAGQITIAATTPGTTTLNSTPGKKLRAQWSSATLIKTAANTWLIMGDLVA